MAPMAKVIFTIGHSRHGLEEFVDLLNQHEIEVRSNPYSRMNPQFNREPLKRALSNLGIAYVFLGLELGARRDDPTCYQDGRVQFRLVANNELFRTGLQRVETGLGRYRIALMCAEADAADCHRTILVGRHLEARSVEVRHVSATGALETQAEVMDRLALQLHLPQTTLFNTRQQVIEEAYRVQEQRIAYRLPASPVR